jgi:hypothetical protein
MSEEIQKTPAEVIADSIFKNALTGELTPYQKRVVFDNILDTLNSAFKADPVAIYMLLCMRVPAGQGLLDHPTVVCGKIPRLESIEEAYYVGPLGWLNSVIETATGKRVASYYGEPDASGDRPLLGFIEYKESLRAQPGVEVTPVDKDKKDIQGTPITKEEAYKGLGDPVGWDKDAKDLNAKYEEKPVVLCNISEADNEWNKEALKLSAKA